MEGRVANVCRYVEREAVAATMPDLILTDRDRRRRNGRTAQVHVRATARTNGTSAGTSGAFWDMQQADKVHRVRNAGVFLLLWPVAFTGDLAVCSSTSIRLPCVSA